MKNEITLYQSGDESEELKDTVQNLLQRSKIFVIYQLNSLGSSVGAKQNI